MSKLVLSVRGLHCAGCVQRLQRILRHQPNVVDATIDFQGGRAVLTLSGEPEFAAYEAAIENAGFVYAGAVPASES